jgi:hypothetical protein
MKNTIVKNLIVESVPVIGVFNKVIDADLDIVPQAELFAFTPGKFLSDKSRAGLDAFEFLFYLANVRADRSASLLKRVDYRDFDPKNGHDSLLWQDDYEKVLENAFRNGIVKDLVVMDKKKVTHYPNGQKILLDSRGF